MSSSFPSPILAPSSNDVIASRSINPRRSLPGARAITGGVLIAVAAIATFVAATGSTSDHTQPVLVAARDLSAGTRLTANDLAVVRMNVPSALSSHVIHNQSTVAGATLLAPLKSGELLQTGEIVNNKSAEIGPQLAIAIPSSRALGGTLRPGDVVDVVVSDKTGSTTTRTAVSGARIVSASSDSNALGHDGNVTVTFAVSTRADAVAIASANDQGQITLVRTTGIASVAE